MVSLDEEIQKDKQKHRSQKPNKNVTRFLILSNPSVTKNSEALLISIVKSERTIGNDKAVDLETTEMTEDREGSTKKKNKTLEDHTPKLQERKRARKESHEFQDLLERNPT